MAGATDPHSLSANGHHSRALTVLGDVATRRALLTDEQVLRAELFSQTGAVEDALRRAEQLIGQKGLSTKQRCRLRDVLGVSNYRKGLYTKGHEHYRRGIELAETGGELESECRLRVHLLRNQNHWVGAQQASVALGLLRTKVHRLGNPSISLEFQLGLTELAAKLGLGTRARTHLNAAVSLLATVSDRSIHGDVKIAEIALDALDSNVESALQRGFELVAIAEDTGGESARFGAATNLGHLLLLQSRPSEALDWLKRGLKERSFGGGPEIALRDTLMFLHLAQSHTAEAELEAQIIERLLEQTGTHDSYMGLWHLVTRVKLLFRTGDHDAGLALALGALPRVKRIADLNLLARMKLLAAEGLGRVGRAGDGARLLAEAVSGNSDPPLEMMAEAARVAGRLSSADNHAAALSHFDRAERILAGVGNLTARAEIQRDALETVPSHRRDAPVLTGANTGGFTVHEDEQPTRPVDTRPAAATVTERIAALIDVAAHPPLLAAETLALISDGGAVLSAAIVATGADGVRERLAAFDAPDPGADARDSTVVRIPLGSHRDRDYAIEARPRESATARSTLLAVERLVQTSLALVRARHQEREQTALWPEPSPEQQLGLVCASEKMLDLVKSVRRVAASNITILITGETGVGKELFARALHQASPRHDRTFMPFNCSTVPREILDSQLFGYRRGAFTGAQDDSPGIIRSAAGGTLFLDEIGEMALEAQPKLLRFLESGELLPLGEARPQFADVRIVAATNANLDQLVAEGKFREDLYYRLNVIPLHVPALRERREEIPLLVDHFLDKFSHELQKPMLRVAEETLEYLVLYRWPGNVRQLANEIRRMVALAEAGAVLMPEHLSPVIAASRRTVPAGERTLEPTEVVVRIDQPIAAATEHLERALIQRALKLCDGKVEEAAAMLGLSRKGLYLKRQRLGIE